MIVSSPVTITQRTSSRGMISAKLPRIAWSSAPRLPGLEMVRRVTPGDGSSTSSRPPAPAGLVEDNERVALGHRLPLLHADLAHHARILGLDRHLHLHRLEDHDRVAFLPAVPH